MPIERNNNRGTGMSKIYRLRGLSPLPGKARQPCGRDKRPSKGRAKGATILHR